MASSVLLHGGNVETARTVQEMLADATWHGISGGVHHSDVAARQHLTELATEKSRYRHDPFTGLRLRDSDLVPI
ncbi:hypothetical protein BRADO5626 [Bradyrhizobium sp. ORS 278]|nr:hypothetical protein BRADO5626 [Bradyrhizobium sp. ORS 278]